MNSVKSQQEQRLKKGDPIFPRLDHDQEVNYIKEKMQGTAPKEEEKTEEKEEQLTRNYN